MSNQSDPDALRTVYVGAISVLITLVLIVALQAAYYQAQESEISRKAVASEELTALRAEQLELLEGYRWIDRSKGTVTIPIDRAMELVVRDLAADSTRPQVPAKAAAQ
ncbi:MAG: hypothetical protein HZB43_13460 [candidate division Zixibacteria bacterium]|nr:hypothetical protein [candidate division Zixibacteria bacterium]